MRMKYPSWLTGKLLYLQGLRDLADKREYRRLLNENKGLSARDRAIVRRLSIYGGKFRDFLLEYLSCEISCLKTVPFSAEEPTVICVVRNDLMRMQLFLEYYRSMGIHSFAVLDDHSTDGTREFLLQQPDTAVFETEQGYTTVRRQVWLNKMISQIGVHHWYLIADSDELFDYPGRAQGVTLRQFAEGLAQKNQTRVKALLLDMYAEDQLFSDRVKTYSDITEVYRFYYPRYRMVPNNYGTWIKGGARGAMFEKLGLKAEPVVSKYPLVYVDDREIILHSHYGYPFTRNKPDYASAVLRHYKFLPGDRKKYEERIQKQNFEKGSAEYLAYASAETKVDFAELAKDMVEYTGFDKLLELSVMKK